MRSAIITFLGLALIARAATADVIHVPADYPTIQAAIFATFHGDEIVIAPGTYNERISFGGNAITVRGSGRDLTIINGQGVSGLSAVVRFANGEGPSSVLRDLTVTSGLECGGIDATNTNPTIINCHITGNRRCCFGGGFSGGGLNQSGPLMLVQDCVFSNNSVSASMMSSGVGRGGGAAVQNALFINCAFINNQAEGSSFLGSQGGADGGGVAVGFGGSGILINCFIHGNSAMGDGHAYGGGVANGNLITMVNCVITNNSVSVSDPAGVADGAGLRTSSGTTVLTNCTIANNTVVTPSASTLAGGVSGASSLANCIVVGNTGTDVHSSAVAHHSCIEGGFPGEGNIDDDPLFIDPVKGNFRLQEGSPCRDAGDNAALPLDTYDLDDDRNTAEQLSRDLDLLRRNVNGIVDIGAHEWQRTCLPDISPSSPGVAGDGVVDVDDLVAVILGWGACDQCVADINDDNVVDVDDLILIILNWGRCP